jgi:Spy/CpxP family protein refolding chaperone
MTAEQLETIQELRDEFHEATEGLRDQLREAREEFRELLRDADPDLGAVRAAKERLDNLETEMLLAGLEQRAEVRDVLTAEQQVFFDELHHGRPGRRGGHPGMGPGGPQGPGPEGR